MDKATVSKTFSPKKYTDSKLLQKAGTVLERMTDNDYFPNVQSRLDELRAKIQSYTMAISESNQGGRLSTAIKINCRKELEEYLKELADYVQQGSKGDQLAILSTGFDIHKKPSRVGELDKPTYVKLEVGPYKGSLWLSCAVVDKALFYVFEYCLAPMGPDSVWVQVTSSRRKILIDGLISGKEYCFRIAAARTDPSRIWSDPVKSYVL